MDAASASEREASGFAAVGDAQYADGRRHVRTVGDEDAVSGRADGDEVRVERKNPLPSGPVEREQVEPLAGADAICE